MRIDLIAANLQRSTTAISQRASVKGWKRLLSVNTVDGVNQSPEVFNGITSGTTIGGRSIMLE